MVIEPLKKNQKWIHNQHGITFELCVSPTQIEKNKNKTKETHNLPFIVDLDRMIYLPDHVPLLLISLPNDLGSLLTYS